MVFSTYTRPVVLSHENAYHYSAFFEYNQYQVPGIKPMPAETKCEATALPTLPLELSTFISVSVT